MNKGKMAALAVALLCGLAVAGMAWAISSTNYAIDWSVMGGGGGPISSTSYSMNSTIGQAVIGSKSSTSFQVGSGFWPGVIAVEIGPLRIYVPIILKSYAP